MTTNIKPTTDFVFKRLFGDIDTKETLISFLEAILKEAIDDVEILNTDIEKKYPLDKLSRLDIKAKTGCGKIINIEVQIKNTDDMIKRSLYYWSKMYESQVESNDKYKVANKTICINLLEYNIFTDSMKDRKYHSIFRLKDIETNKELTDIIELHFIELKKINTSDSIKDMLDAWMIFLKDPFILNINSIHDEKNRKAMSLALSKYKEMNGDVKVRERYQLYREAELEENSRLNAHFISKIKKMYSNGASLELIKLVFDDYSDSELRMIISEFQE